MFLRLISVLQGLHKEGESKLLCLLEVLLRRKVKLNGLQIKYPY